MTLPLLPVLPILQLIPGAEDDSAVTVPTEIVLLLLVLGLIIVMWDLFDRRSKSARKETGLDEKTEVLSVRGGSTLPGKEYYSEELALVSKPDALIKEEGMVIPVDVKPMTDKVRDRHVVAMLLHLKLMEEITGERPPYGILLMGQKRRQVKIKNTEEKQRWLDSLIDEMRSICDGVPAVPAPSVYKCKHCDVRAICTHKAEDK
ncbi:MAG TPA: Dna2/Cas4 domain-containing protein [Oligoflexia bacterium]|nr:Dna2/Cas4 domain-containing protein [Oligoflexia bacterium]